MDAGLEDALCRVFAAVVQADPVLTSTTKKKGPAQRRKRQRSEGDEATDKTHRPSLRGKGKDDDEDDDEYKEKHGGEQRLHSRLRDSVKQACLVCGSLYVVSNMRRHWNSMHVLKDIERVGTMGHYKCPFFR
jgi:folylpolyglutamate synthase/dihydropteroate synthase